MAVEKGCGERLHLPEGFISQQKPADEPVQEGETFSPAVDSGQVFTDKPSVQVPPQGGLCRFQLLLVPPDCAPHHLP